MEREKKDNQLKLQKSFHRLYTPDVAEEGVSSAGVGDMGDIVHDDNSNNNNGDYEDDDGSDSESAPDGESISTHMKSLNSLDLDGDSVMSPVHGGADRTVSQDTALWGHGSDLQKQLEATKKGIVNMSRMSIVERRLARRSLKKANLKAEVAKERDMASMRAAQKYMQDLVEDESDEVLLISAA